jgi:hypothetical protein
MTNFKRYLATVAIVGAAIVAIVAIVIRGNLTPEELAANRATEQAVAPPAGDECAIITGTDKNCDECLMSDNRPDGTEFCEKMSTGMSQEQIDAWYYEDAIRREAREAAADAIRREAEGKKRAPSTARKPQEQRATLGSCLAAIEIAEMHDNEWQAPFSKEDCAEVAGKSIDDGMATIKKGQE